MLAGFLKIDAQAGDSRIEAISTAAGPPAKKRSAAGPPAKSDQPDAIIEPGRGAGRDGPPDIAAA